MMFANTCCMKFFSVEMETYVILYIDDTITLVIINARMMFINTTMFINTAC
jgi:hypothetical protein